MLVSPDTLAAKLPAWLHEDAPQPHWVAGASSPAPEPVTEHEPNPYPKPGAEPFEPAPRRKFDHGRMMSWNFEPEKWKGLFDVDHPIPIFTPKTTTRPPPEFVRSNAKVPFEEYDDDEYDYEDYDHSLIDPLPPTKPSIPPPPPADDCPPCSRKCDGVNGIQMQ